MKPLHTLAVFFVLFIIAAGLSLPLQAQFLPSPAQQSETSSPDSTGDQTSEDATTDGPNLKQKASDLGSELVEVVTERNDIWQFGALFGCIFVGMLLAKIVGLLLSKLAGKGDLCDRSVRQMLLKALSQSLVLLGLVIGLRIGALFIEMTPTVESFYFLIVEILLVIAIALMAFRFVDIPVELLRRRAEDSESGFGKMLVPLIRSSLRAAIIIFALLELVEAVSDESLTSIIAGLGIGGLALAFAAQDMLKNFFGSVMLFTDRPFDMGDRIIFGDHDGTIESVGVRSTRIRRLDGHLVTVPNGILANEAIHNVAKRPFIRRLLNVTVTYDTTPEKIEEGKKIILDLLKQPEVNEGDMVPRVYFNDFKAASLNIFVIYWYHPPKYWDYMQHADAFNTGLLREFNAAGIDFAFPTQTLHLPELEAFLADEEARALRNGSASGGGSSDSKSGGEKSSSAPPAEEEHTGDAADK
ncbi:MAG: mechanosensitive ion channel family protein [Opitutales bacterium]